MSNVTKPECPLTTQGETKLSPHYGHQRANTMYTSSQNTASKTVHKSPNGANSKHRDTKYHKGQPNLVSRPTWTEKTEEPQEQKCHEVILSVNIDDTQKSTYNAKVSSMEATALFDSGAMLSCVSKHFYNRISCTEPSRVIDTNTGPANIVTSASDDELINLGLCRLRIKLGDKTFEYYFLNTQEPKTRHYTRSQLSKNIQNITRHHG